MPMPAIVFLYCVPWGSRSIIKNVFASLRPTLLFFQKKAIPIFTPFEHIR